MAESCKVELMSHTRRVQQTIAAALKIIKSKVVVFFQLQHIDFVQCVAHYSKNGGLFFMSSQLQMKHFPAGLVTTWIQMNAYYFKRIYQAWSSLSVICWSGN